MKKKKLNEYLAYIMTFMLIFMLCSQKLIFAKQKIQEEQNNEQILELNDLNGKIIESILAEKNLNKQQINHIRNFGFTLDEIKDMESWELEKFLSMEGNLIAKKERYFRITNNKFMVEITKEECEKQVRNHKANELKKKKIYNGEAEKNDIVNMLSFSDTSEDSWIKLTTTVSEIGYRKYACKNSFTWLTEPIVRLTDIVAITHSAGVSTKSGTEYLSYSYDEFDEGVFKNVRTFKQTTDCKKSSGGYAFSYDIRNGYDGNPEMKNWRGYMYYEVNANPGWQNIYGHYSHQISLSWISISLGYGVVSVSPGFAFADASDTDVQFFVK